MKRLIFISILCFPLYTFTQTLPSWISNPPSSNDKFYAVGVGTSMNLEIAKRKATMDASVGLAEKVEPALVTITTKLIPVLKGNTQLIEKVNVTRKTVSATLYNTKIAEIHNVEDEKGSQTVYVLLEMPKKEVTRSLIAEIKKDSELQKALQSSKEYKKLRKE